MSAIQFLMKGGMAIIGGDLPESDKKTANEAVKTFGEKVRQYGLSLQVPAAILKVQQCTFLFIAKDTSSFHFVFADAPGGTSLNYQDLSSYGRLELQSIVHRVRIGEGDVAWAFSCPLNIPVAEYIQGIAQQYVNSVLQSQHRSTRKISDEAMAVPEIASGLEKFRQIRGQYINFPTVIWNLCEVDVLSPDFRWNPKNAVTDQRLYL